MGIFDMFRKKGETEARQPSASSDNAKSMHKSEPEIIIQSSSMVCDVEAFVEKTDSCYYFYLFFPMSSQQKIKCCWICNRLRAPEKLDINDMDNGRAPRMPAEYVAHDLNGIELDEKKLSIVWFEEGDSAALLCGEEIICVIPEWSGYKDFHGYSKYARGTGSYAWELTGAVKTLSERVENSRKLWEFFGNKERSTTWMMKQRSQAMKFIGKHENDYDIGHKNDRVIGDMKFPPKVVVSGSRDGVVYGVTAGVSLIAMPMVGFHVEGDPKNIRRMELGFAAEERFRQICHPMYANLSMYAGIPWQQLTFLAHGHTIPFRNIKGFAAVLFVNPRNVEGLESPEYVDFLDGGTVNMLWTVPITQEEYDFAVNHDSEKLMKKAVDISRIHIFDGKSKFSM